MSIINHMGILDFQFISLLASRVTKAIASCLRADKDGNEGQTPNKAVRAFGSVLSLQKDLRADATLGER